MSGSAENRKVAVITASYSGIGAELCRLLARDGFELVFVNRNRMRTVRQIQDLKSTVSEVNVRTVIADLSDHEQIREAAKAIAACHGRIDLLINNAGVLLDRTRMSRQANDLHFEVNTVAPYLLSTLLRPQLRAAHRPSVVTVGSSAMRMTGKLDLANLRVPAKFKKFKPYAQSKLAVAAAFFAMCEDFGKDGIKLRVVDPGMNKTAMSTGSGVPGLFKLMSRFFPAPDTGARRIYEAACNPKFRDRSGIYIERGKISRPPASVTSREVQQALLQLLRKVAE